MRTFKHKLINWWNENLFEWNQLICFCEKERNVQGRTPPAAAKTIPINSLRMDWLDCFALRRRMRHQGKQQFRMSCGMVCRGELRNLIWWLIVWVVWMTGGLGAAAGRTAPQREDKQQHQTIMKSNKWSRRNKRESAAERRQELKDLIEFNEIKDSSSAATSLCQRGPKQLTLRGKLHQLSLSFVGPLKRRQKERNELCGGCGPLREAVGPTALFNSALSAINHQLMKWIDWIDLLRLNWKRMLLEKRNWNVIITVNRLHRN